MRDNIWLKNKLEDLWIGYFADVPKLNTVEISFGKRAKRRLASIRQKNRYSKKSDTKIIVTGYYKDERVPEYVVDATIAHELCHYAHGFASPLPQYSRFPHKGDLVDNELVKRGLGEVLEKQQDWLKQTWNEIVKSNVFAPNQPRRRKKVLRKTKTFSVIKLINKLLLS